MVLFLMLVASKFGIEIANEHLEKTMIETVTIANVDRYFIAIPSLGIR